MTSSFYFSCVEEKVHKKEGDISYDDDYGQINRRYDDGYSREDIIVDDGRSRSRYKDTNKFTSFNTGETVGVDGRGGY